MSEGGDASGGRDEPSNEERSESRFAHLLDEFDETTDADAETESGSGPDASTEGADTAQPADGTDSLSRIVPVDIHPLASGTSQNTDRPSWGSKKLLVVIGLGVVLALVVPGVLALPVTDVSETLSGSPPVGEITADETITLESDDAVYLSRVFEERTYEVAYCGRTTDADGTLRVDIWMADTVSASPDETEFSTDNCPSDFDEVQLHTHPSGNLALSDVDRETLNEGSWEFMCVQGGELTTEPGADVENLACYTEVETPKGEFDTERMAVAIAE